MAKLGLSHAETFGAVGEFVYVKSDKSQMLT
jgi:hypothetical protein